MNTSAIRAGVNLGLFLGLVGALLGPYVVMLIVAPKKRYVIAQAYFKGCLKLTGLKLTLKGRPDPRAVLFAGNHCSYLDIPVLGAVIGGGVFVAKSEVADWPLFGFLARISRTIFISRNSVEAKQQRTLLAERMNRGSRLILFPEGTSTDGSVVKRFKSSLFAALEDVDRDAWVQPVGVVYARSRDGQPLSQDQRELYTWFGDMTLAPHLINVMGMRGCEVEVMFHEPLLASEFEDRKLLAKTCEHAVAKHLIETVGKLEELPPVVSAATETPASGMISPALSDDFLVEPAPAIGAR